MRVEPATSTGRPRPASVRGPALAALVVALAACGGGHKATVPTVPIQPASTVTSPSRSTTTAAPTAAATTSTTVAATVAPSTSTVAPTSTTLALDQQVIAAHERQRANYNVCLADPGKCDVSTLAEAGSAAYAANEKLMAQLAHDGLRGRPSTNPDEDYVVYRETDVTEKRRIVRTLSHEATPERACLGSERTGARLGPAGRSERL